jgi:hypothetical protein
MKPDLTIESNRKLPGGMMTFPELFDDARDGEEFGRVLNALFCALEVAIASEEDAEE